MGGEQTEPAHYGRRAWKTEKEEEEAAKQSIARAKRRADPQVAASASRGGLCDYGSVRVEELRKVALLAFRKAFCNYHHFTTVGLGRLVTLLPLLKRDPDIEVLIPAPNKKGQTFPFIAESLALLGISIERIRVFRPCTLHFAKRALVAGLGPRARFGPAIVGPEGPGMAPRVRGTSLVMADIVDEAPARAVRHAMFHALGLPARGSGGGNTLGPRAAHTLLLDRKERRRRLKNVKELSGFLRDSLRRPLQGPEYCEELSVAEQVRAFHGAALVVAVNGACLANLLYVAQPEAAVVVLTPVENFIGRGVTWPLDECGIGDHFASARNAGVRYAAILVLTDFDADSMEVPVPAVAEALWRIGLHSTTDKVPVLRAGPMAFATM